MQRNSSRTSGRAWPAVIGIGIWASALAMGGAACTQAASSSGGDTSTTSSDTAGSGTDGFALDIQTALDVSLDLVAPSDLPKPLDLTQPDAPIVVPDVPGVDGVGPDALVGSCAGRCGAAFDKNQPCQCNSACVGKGDCCADVCLVCSAVDVPSCGPVGDGSCKGKCSATFDKTAPCQCNNLCESFKNCCADYATYCNPACVPDCTGKKCGDNGCNGSCGTCPGGAICNPDGSCASSSPCGECFTGTTCAGGAPGKLNPCLGAACGNVDSTGGCFGDNKDKAVFCQAGQLISLDCSLTNQTCGLVPGPNGGAPSFGCVCKPACGGKACGDDGCGGSCGNCGTAATCQAGVCVPKCVPSCGGKACGDDGCGGSCGNCGTAATCNAGVCVPNCVPKCATGSCGDDGCGGKCGPCKSGESCVSDKCTVPDPCVAAPDGCACLIGKCQPSAVAAVCDGVSAGCQAAIAKEYKATGCMTCNSISFPGLKALCKDAACANDLGNIKVTAPALCDSKCFCQPSCGTKKCGDDGCGGSCGSCASGKSCSSGQCVDSCSLSSGRPLFCACSAKEQCSSNACVSINNKSMCTHDCSKDSDCEVGTGCKFSVSVGGFTVKYCTP